MAPNETPPEAEALFAQLVTRFSKDPSVTPPSATKGRSFGASALKADGKIIAMLAAGELVVKLPRRRVDELVASGTGRPFDPGHGRVMKEWVAVNPREAGVWGELAREAREYVAATPSKRRRG